MDVNVLSQGRQNTDDIVIRQMDNRALSNSQSDYTGVSNDKSDKTKEINEADVKKATEKVNKLFEDKNTHVEYEFHGKSKRMSIKIIDNNTKEVVKEIPPKKLIDMVDKLCELAGLVMDEKA